MKRIFTLILSNFVIVIHLSFAQQIPFTKTAGQLQIVSTLPLNHSNTSSPQTSISVTFQEALDSATVTSETFSVWGNISGKHEGNIVINNSSRTITLLPHREFIRGEKVQAVLSNKITSLAGGNTVASGYSWKFQTATSFGTDTFTVETNTISPPSKPFALTTGDFNNDGYPDFAVTHTENNTFSLYLNSKAGGYFPPKTFATGGGPSAILAADFDGNGAIDIAVTNSTGNSVGIFLNDQAGGFLSMVSCTVGVNPQAMSAADIDNDGDMDIVSANMGDNSLSVLKNSGQGLFTCTSKVQVGNSPSGVVLSDFNNDGITEGVACNRNSNSFTLLKNIDGSLQTDTTYVVTSPNGTSAPNDVSVYDFDNDGDLDIAIASGGSKDIEIFLNAYQGVPLGRFTMLPQVIPTGVAPAVLYGNDLDSDGDIDLVMGSQAATIYGATVLVNKGMAVPALLDIATQTGVRGVTGLDMSGMYGVIDLIFSCMDGKIRILRAKPVGGLPVRARVSKSMVNFGITRDSSQASVTLYSSLMPVHLDSISFQSKYFTLTSSYRRDLLAYDSVTIGLNFKPRLGIIYKDTVKVYFGNTSLPLTIALEGKGDPSLAIEWDGEQIPHTFCLEQNYPNPFNPETRIEFSVGTYGHTSLRIHDLLGREVAVLVNEQKLPGRYTVIWNASGFSGGIYFYTLRVIPLNRTRDNIYSSTKKLLLLK